MRRIILDFNIHNGGKAAETLSSNTQLVHLLHNLQTQFFQTVGRSSLTQFVDIDWIHKRLFSH